MEPMSKTEYSAPIAKRFLSDDELRVARDLKQRCNAYDGLDLKLSLDVPELDNVRDHTNIFVVYANEHVVGVCTLDGAREVEICGAVHPDHRRQGIGRSLLNAALTECRQRESQRVLLICEEASAAGQALAQAQGGHIDFAEHRMVLDATQAALPTSSHGVTTHRAGPDDIATLARITASAFDHNEDELRQSIADDLADTRQSFILGEHNGIPVGSLKLYFAPDRVFIYAFGVLPEQRGKGLGRAILSQTIETLRNQGFTHIGLEVETTNARAFALYRSCGFVVRTTYDYYELPS